MLNIKYKVVICGEAIVGKTCLVMRYTENKFMETKSTIGVAFAVKDVHTEEQGKIRLQMWDFAGEERFRTLLGPFCIGASGAIMLYDLTNPVSFTHLDEWMEIARSHTGESDRIGKKKPIPVVLAGSKKDLLKGSDRPVKKEVLNAFMKKHGITSYHEISSRTGENVEVVFKDLVKLMLAVDARKARFYMSGVPYRLVAPVARGSFHEMNYMSMKVKDLKPDANATVKVRVCAAGQSRQVSSKKGYPLTVSTFGIGDETGRVEFSAFGKDVASLSKNVGKVIQIKEAWVKQWNGKLQVSLGKNGTWEVVEDKTFPLTSDIMKLPMIGSSGEDDEDAEKE